MKSGPVLGRQGDFLTKDGKPFFPFGTNYFTTEENGWDFSGPRNASVWEHDFADMERHDVSFVRTGVWMGQIKIVDPVEGGVTERFLRNVEAYLLCARRHNIAINFTFFAFDPQATLRQGDNPLTLLPGGNPYMDPITIQAVICPTRFPHATLYVVSCDTDQSDISFRDIMSGKEFASRLEPGRAALLLIGEKGDLLASQLEQCLTLLTVMDDFPRFNLTGQTALVTGAARGLGRAISLALAHAGADVALGLRDINAHGGLVAEIESLGRRTLPLQMDMTCLEEIHKAVEVTIAQFGRLDVLVNNAGVAPGNLAENVTEEDFDLTLAINLKGTFFASQAAARVMIPQRRGCIINMSSQAGFAALPSESVYCMTKAGIAHLTKCLAVEWGPHGIRVNAVAPTFIHTTGTEPALSDPQFRADVVERIAALHRIGEPMEVAGSVVFLASSAASLITGHTLLIDGGWTAR